MRVMTAERNWIWALITAFVFLVAMALTTCAKAASHHRRTYEASKHHHITRQVFLWHPFARAPQQRHRVAAAPRRQTATRHHRARLYARHQAPAHRNRSTPRVMAAASRELAALPSGSSTRLVSAMRSHLGGNPTGWSHNWCAHYLDMELRASGYRGGGNLARGYARYGRPCGPQPGAIAVMPHHVGVVMSVGPGYVLLVSGNHGHRVGIGRYSRSRIIAYRLPA